MSNITVASRQLFSRTPDTYCTSLDHMVSRLEEREHHTRIVDMKGIHVAPSLYRESLNVTHRSGTIFNLNHTSFSQLCGMVGGGAGVINKLSDDTASRALNELIASTGISSKEYRINALGHQDGVDLRSFYSPRYERVPDVEVAKHFRSLANNYGYEPAGTFAGKRGGLPPIKPDATGLYVGEHDIFGFLANERDPVETRSDSALYSAIIFGNSECKTATVYWMHVYYEFICGNMQLWNVGYKNEARQKHIGTPRDVLVSATEAFQKAEADQISVKDKIYKAVKSAQRTMFADTIALTQDKLEKYLDKKKASGVLQFLDHPRAYPANPLSVYGVGQAVTLFSQTYGNADERLSIDRIGGKILSSVHV